MLSDDVKNRYMPTPKRRKAGGEGYRRHYSDSQKIEAVTTYIMLGSLKLAAGTLKIPHDTMKLWKKSEWWKEVENDLRIQEDLQLSKRLQNIVNRSLDVVEDRLENGDFIYDQKTGKMRRKPVQMKDAHKISMDMHERHQDLLDRHMADTSITTDKIETRLADLAKEFARIASKVTSGPVEITEVLFGDDKPNAKDE